MPAASKMFEVRLDNFIVLEVYQMGHLTLATQSSNGYTFSKDHAVFVTAKHLVGLLITEGD